MRVPRCSQGLQATFFATSASIFWCLLSYPQGFQETYLPSLFSLCVLSRSQGFQDTLSALSGNSWYPTSGRLVVHEAYQRHFWYNPAGLVLLEFRFSAFLRCFFPRAIHRMRFVLKRTPKDAAYKDVKNIQEHHARPHWNLEI